MWLQKNRIAWDYSSRFPSFVLIWLVAKVSIWKLFSFVMLISRSIISWFAELGEASNQSNSPASIPRTIHQCHHCTGALSSSTSSISSSCLSSSNHHHCHHRRHHHQWRDTQAEDGPMEFSISVPNLQETSLHRTPVFNRWSNVPAIVNTDGEAGIKWQPQYFSWWQLLWCTVGKTCRRVRAIFFQTVPKSSQSSPKTSLSIPYLVLRKSQSSSQAFSK